jgi:hypothetical protein
MLPDATAARGKPAAPRGSAPAKRLPRLGFLKGAALGVVVVLPSVAAAVWILARAGIGNPRVTMVEALRMATIFAGAAAVLTAGGIGRLAAHTSITPGGLRASIMRSVQAQAVAGAGLVIIAAIPHGELPVEPWVWAWFAVAGAIGGALSGLIIGLVCGAPVSERLPTVQEMARLIPRLIPVMGEIERVETEKAAEPKPEPAPEPPPEPAKPPERSEPVALPLEAAPEAEPEPEPELTPAPTAVDPEAPPADKDQARRQRRAGRKALMLETARQEQSTPRPKLVKPERLSIERSAATGAPTTPVSTATPSVTTTGGGATPLPIPIPLGESMPVQMSAVDPDAIEETNIEGAIGETVDVNRASVTDIRTDVRTDVAAEPTAESTATGATEPERTGQHDEDAETAVKDPHP